MTNRERFRKTMEFQPVDRLPAYEWACWWNLTIDRWHNEGLPKSLTDGCDIGEYLGLDLIRQYWIDPRSRACPRASGHGMPIITSRDDYLAIKKHLYPEQPFDEKIVEQWVARHKCGDLAVWITLEGPFWYPRTMLGIEPHLYAFYDQPDLMKEMNEDLAAFNARALDRFCEILTPDFMTFAEDMSYNHGPMLSKEQFDEFMAPYYRTMVPELDRHGVVTFIDTDGDITIASDWFSGVGVSGLLPLERMAGVDVSMLRRRNPGLRMIGAFDKTVMHLGEARVRQEFERLLPVMRQGGFVAGVDHQTPPAVSLAQYRVFVRLLKEYGERAAREFTGPVPRRND